MPSSSSRSASDIYRDKDAILATLRRLAAGAMARHDALQRVLLFGSLARGDYGLYSDADILLVLEHSEHSRYFDRIPDLLVDFEESPVPVELFPYTEAELRQMQADGNSFIRDALAQSVVLADRQATG